MAGTIKKLKVNVETILKYTFFACVLTFLVSPIPAITGKYHYVVAADYSGHFRTVQEAINAVPDFRKNETRIFIKKGTYKEKLILAEYRNTRSGASLSKRVNWSHQLSDKKAVTFTPENILGGVGRKIQVIHHS